MRAIAALMAWTCLIAWAGSVSGQTLTPTSPPPLTPANPPGSPTNPPGGPSNPPTNTPPAVVTLATFSVGNWSAGAYAVDGKFDHCAGAVTYNSGISVAFYVSNTFQWAMGLLDPSWNLTAGSSYPVAFTIDGSAPNFATAYVSTAKEVLIPLNPTVALFKTFMEGEVLKVDAATQVFTFNLTDTSKLLPDLLKCVESYVGTAPASSNPFVANAGK